MSLPTSVLLQKLQMPFSFSSVVPDLIVLRNVRATPVGNEALIHHEGEFKVGLLAFISFISGPVFLGKRSIGLKIAVPPVLQQGQIAVAGNGVLIRTFKEDFPVNAGPQDFIKISPFRPEQFHPLSACCFPLNVIFRFRGFDKGVVSRLVFGKLGSHFLKTLQIIPRPPGVGAVKGPARNPICHKKRSAFALQDDRALQLIKIRRGYSKAGAQQKGANNEC